MALALYKRWTRLLSQLTRTSDYERLLVSSILLQACCQYFGLCGQLPKKERTNNDTLFSLLSAEFDLEVHVYDACSRCYGGAGLCVLDKNGKFQCAIAKKGMDIE
ncbi:hypothetical protein CFP56_001503 [Quercus suber]|uniref:Uncharacterized protein n=1 Tax=Quercus suber TaxID=58331 RepID=A0AAW0LGY5_QUESU